MSNVKSDRDGSVGIITRADVAGARQQAQDAVKDAEKLRDETTGAEGAQKRAEGEIHRVAKDIDGASDGAEGLDVPPPEEVDVWGVDTETGQPFPRPGRPQPLPGQGGPLQPGGGAAGAPGQPQPGAPAGGPPGAAPRMRHLPLPSMYPGTRRRTPGALPTVQPAMWARGIKAAAGVVGTVAGKVEQVGRRVAGVTAAYMAQHIIRAPGVADRYDQEIARQIAALGMSTPHNVSERWKVDKSPGWGTRWDRAEGDNTIAFRRQLNTIRDLFQMTGDEYLAMTRELGPYANQRRAVVGTAMIAREYGITGAQAGRFQRTFAEHTDIGRRRAYSTTEAQQPIGHFMEFGGMRDRAGLFMDDAAGFARSMAQGQGAADSSSVLGYTAWLGSIGLGTRGDIGRRLLTGASRHGGDMIHALKIRAVQTFLSSERVRESSANGARTVKDRAGFTLGAGRNAVHLDTRGSLFDAELAIGSKDPRLLPAYKRMAQRLAREHGGLNPKDYAMTVFGQMAGVNPAQVRKVWNDLGALDDVDLLSRTPEQDVTWTQGPYYDGGGKDGKTSGAVAAAMDQQQHALGHGMNYLLRSVNEGLTVAVAGMQANKGITSSLLEGLYMLDPDLLKLGALSGALQGGIGGRAQAALLGGVLATRDVVNLPKNIKGFVVAMQPSPVPDVGADAGPAAPYAGPTERMTRDDVRQMATSYGATEADMIAAITAGSEDPRRTNSKVVMHALYNQAMGTSADRLWTAATGTRGTTGEQNVNFKANFATSRIRDEKTMQRLLNTAREVRSLREAGVDPTGGVTMFMHPEAQRRAHEANPRKSMPPEDVEARWIKRGMEPVEFEGQESGESPVRFFRRAQPGNAAPAVSAVQAPSVASHVPAAPAAPTTSAVPAATSPPTRPADKQQTDDHHYGTTVGQTREWAKEVGVSFDDFLLARMAYNESKTTTGRKHAMHAALNRVSTGLAPDLQHAILGDQDSTGPRGGSDGRPMNTAELPERKMLRSLFDMATQVQAERRAGVDPTKGATDVAPSRVQRK